ncbi:ribosomal protein S18-alanine N-acetyltransferase [Achromobacter sp. Bel]|nr:ribosomal protein S18-alanine N-acetyltransferase [Achromobacter sp. Bel]
MAFTTAERLRGEGGNPKAQPSLAPQAPLIPQPLTDADLDEVVTLEAHVQAFPWTRGNFADALAAGYGAWVLRREGKVAGFCILMFAPDVAHLLVIAVAKPLHRQGLGGVLLDWCEQQARQRGLEGVLLEVRPSNASAVSFYQQHGYLQIGVRRGYYPAAKGAREDALVMQKRFAAVAEEAA